MEGGKNGAGKLIDLVKDEGLRKGLHDIKDNFFKGASSGL